MNTAVSGSRTFTDRTFVEHVIERLLERGDGIIIGDAPSGVDLFAFEYLSQRRGIRNDRWQRYRAQWKTLGRAAGHERNGRMVNSADQLIAIYADGPVTPGTSNAVVQAMLKGIPVYIFHEGQWSLDDGFGETTLDRLP